jgi:hypothetical protein
MLATHGLPKQQSVLLVQAPPSAIQELAGGTLAQWRVGGEVMGVSMRQTPVFGDAVPPQQSSSTSQAEAALEPAARQASVTQYARSFR